MSWPRLIVQTINGMIGDPDVFEPLETAVADVTIIGAGPVGTRPLALKYSIGLASRLRSSKRARVLATDLFRNYLTQSLSVRQHMTRWLPHQPGC